MENYARTWDNKCENNEKQGQIIREFGMKNVKTRVNKGLCKNFG